MKAIIQPDLITEYLYKIDNRLQKDLYAATKSTEGGPKINTNTTQRKTNNTYCISFKIFFSELRQK